MSVETVSLFLALLALLALLGAVGGVLVVALDRGGEGPTAGLRDDLAKLALPAAFVVALVSTLGSLYFSEVAKFIPCPLCWYQRICMYPLALLLGIAAFRRDLAIRLYVIAQAGVGAVISIYHSSIQAFPPEGGSSFCTETAPCTERYVWEFGFVSIPFMALCGFAFIIVMMVLAGGRRSTTG